MKKKPTPNEVNLARIDNIRCPQCNGPVNSLELADFSFLTYNATYIAECWSGDIHKDAPRHVFLVTVPINGKVDLTNQDEGEEAKT